jgi:hypothetical protein
MLRFLIECPSMKLEAAKALPLRATVRATRLTTIEGVKRCFMRSPFPFSLTPN